MKRALAFAAPLLLSATAFAQAPAPPAPPPPPGAPADVPSTPGARIGKRDVRVGAAVYRVADGKGVKNVADGKVDKDGRLVLAGDAQLPDRLARGQVIIYVAKPQR